MLTALIGTDTAARKKRLEALLAPHVKAGSEVRQYSDVSLDAGELRALSEQVSLFGGKTVAVISGIADAPEARAAFESVLPLLSGSPEQFFLMEPAVPAAFGKELKAAGAVVETFDLPAKKKEEAFNSFLFTDAFAARKRSQAWALYRAGISAGVSARELHGKLFWIAKTMLLAEKTKNAAEAGVHPFVYGKAKTSAKAFLPGELEGILSALVRIVHDTTLAGSDLEPALEAFLLRSLERK